MCSDDELSPRNRHPPGKGRQLLLRSPRTFNLASEIGQGPFQGVFSRTDRFARGLEGNLLREDDAGQGVRSQLVFNNGPKQMSFHRGEDCLQGRSEEHTSELQSLAYL